MYAGEKMCVGGVGMYIHTKRKKVNLFFVGNCRCRQSLNLLNTIYHIARFLKNIGSHFGIMQDFFPKSSGVVFFFLCI